MTTTFFLLKLPQNPLIFLFSYRYTSELFQNSLSKTFNNTKDKHLLNSLTKIEDKAYKIPPKIQKIEASLSKYKEEKYKHLLEVSQEIFPAKY